jgi:hypothetical protein
MGLATCHTAAGHHMPTPPYVYFGVFPLSGSLSAPADRLPGFMHAQPTHSDGGVRGFRAGALHRGAPSSNARMVTATCCMACVQWSRFCTLRACAWSSSGSILSRGHEGRFKGTASAYRKTCPASYLHVTAMALAGDPVPPVMLRGLMLIRASQLPTAFIWRASGPRRHSSPRGMPSLARSC